MVFHLAEGSILVLDERPGVREKTFAGRSQPHLPCISLEKLNPEFPFQDLNPLRKRGLCETQAGRRTAEVPFVCDCQKSPDVP